MHASNFDDDDVELDNVAGTGVIVLSVLPNGVNFDFTSTMI